MMLDQSFARWLAGRGVRGDLAYGATDEFGFAAIKQRGGISGSPTCPAAQ